MPQYAPDTLSHYLAAVLDTHSEDMPGFEGLHETGRGWHLFRHTFATWCVWGGVDFRILKEWMGHSSVVTTMLYAAVKPALGGALIDGI